MNKFIFTGRLTADPEIKMFEWGNVATFSVAVDRSYKDKQGNKITDFFRVQIKKDALANAAAKILKKGYLVLLEGNVYTSKYEKDGQNRVSTDFMCYSFDIMSSPKKEAVNNEEEDYRF
jgi:single-strand DNA-binding protein